MRGSRIGRVGVGLAFLLAAETAPGSVIVAPTIGGRDGGLTGNVVARPTDGGSILLHNPAGIADLRGPEVSAGLFAQFAAGRYQLPATSYDEKSFEVPLAPTLWAGGFDVAGWRLGAGIYGAVGASYSFAGDDAAGFPNRFLSQLTVAQVGLVAGREIAPGLRIGVQIAPNYGEFRVRMPTPLGPVAYDVDGFGIGGSTGLLWDVLPRTTLGVGYRSPAVVYMRGDATVGGQPDDVAVDFRIPQQVTFGFAQGLGRHITLTGQARWTDYPDFEKGVFEFDQFTALDRPFITAARTTVRWGFGLEAEPTEWTRLRFGFSHEDWMMEEETLTPLLYDTSDTLLSVGSGVDVGAWTVDMVIGTAITEDRVATTSENALFPGRYKFGGSVAGFLVTYRFGSEGA